MSSGLPTEDSTSKFMNTYGIGTYDSQRDNDGTHGEDSEKDDAERSALPGSLMVDPFELDRLLSYPGVQAGFSLPGDIDGVLTNTHPDMETFDSVLTTNSNSKLPNDDDDPASRADYYDNKTLGQYNDFWPTEDNGSYSKDQSSPTVVKNEIHMNKPDGNPWSGKVVQDMSQPYGFPSDYLLNDDNWPKSDFASRVSMDQKEWEREMDKAMKISDEEEKKKAIHSLYSDLEASMEKKRAKTSSLTRVSTNIELVSELTKDFLKEFGKKNLTKRHVLSFLQELGHPQFLSSDIIRCLKLRHSVHVKDVLDEFSVMKQASHGGIPSILNKISSLRDRGTGVATRRSLDECTRALKYVLAVVRSDSEGIE